MILACLRAGEAAGNSFWTDPSSDQSFLKMLQLCKGNLDMGLRVVCILDTHELHRELAVPPGDLLIHAGDFTFFGRGTRAIVGFNDWLGGLLQPWHLL